MPRDCYNQVFRPVFLQAKADGFTDAVATAAAQSAMSDCLAQHANVVQTVQSSVVAPGNRLTDSGPVSPGSDRSAALGTSQK